MTNLPTATATVDDVQMAEAVALLPPRPDAIVTLLTSDNFLPGAQTLLYSLKKTLPSTLTYPPELVVLVTPNVSPATRHALHPVFCTRILEVEPLELKDQQSSSHVESWDNQGALTKLHIFHLEQYETMLYLDADCLVVKDISHLLERGKVYTESSSLIAAAPDIFPPDKFNAGVLVIRPSQVVFDDMMASTTKMESYDGGDTGFLNAYFSDWFTEMPPIARLAFGYNAQRFLHHCTYEKQPSYWDVAIGNDLHVIHYSSSPKPWEKPLEQQQPVIQEHLEESDKEVLRNVKISNELDELWRKWYRKSGNYAEKQHAKARDEQQRQQSAASAAAASRPQQPTSQPASKHDVHKIVMKRYKQLRREGQSTTEAMAIARSQYGLDQMDDVSAGTQVASMFGMS